MRLGGDFSTRILRVIQISCKDMGACFTRPTDSVHIQSQTFVITLTDTNTYTCLV